MQNRITKKEEEVCKMRNYFSDNVRRYPKQKGTFEIFTIANEKELAGEKVIHMEIGRPDFDTPRAIKESAIKAIEKGQVHYTEFIGSFDLRKAISESEYSKTGLRYDPGKEIVITVGATEGLYCIWNVFLDPGDEIMIPSPYYVSYSRQLTYSGACIVEVPVLKDNKIKYNIDDFKSRLTDKTKIILLNSPNNPTGYVMTDDDLNMIAELAIENDLLVVSDECYDSFVFEGTYKSIATLPGMRERTIVVNSSSKTFSMTGWRIGYIMANEDFIREMNRSHSQTSVCATSFAQAGAIEAYKNVYKEVDIMIEEFKSRRDYVANCLNKMDNISFINPEGAFYVFINVGKLGMDGTKFCERLLREKGIAMSPGISFGSDWIDYVRLAYSCSMYDIVEAMNLMKDFIDDNKI